jgi:hypothetical protein
MLAINAATNTVITTLAPIQNILSPRTE